jgi:hypothetical protein
MTAQEGLSRAALSEPSPVERLAIPRVITQTAHLVTWYEQARPSSILVRSTAARSMPRLLITIRGFGTAATGFIGHILTIAIGIALIGADVVGVGCGIAIACLSTEAFRVCIRRIGPRRLKGWLCTASEAWEAVPLNERR